MMEATAAWGWLGALSVACVALAGGRQRYAVAPKPAHGAAGQEPVELTSFHRNYLALHFLLMLADWLQGTNMYTLYKSYGVDPGLLFMTGFVTSAICSTFLGHWVDKYGRKRGCVVYCVLEVVIQVLEHVRDVRLLLLGRVLGGISTALLFSAFESWLVTAHHARGLPEAALRKTFSLASTLNGVSAVLAGLLARLAFSFGGEIAPFQVSLVITIVCLVWILMQWEENCAPPSASTGMELTALASNRRVLALSFVQAGFEGAKYTFVFMWVQTFLNLSKSEARPPIEILFSCLMVALSIGGLVFDLVSCHIQAARHEWIGVFVFCTASFAMACAGLVTSRMLPVALLTGVASPSTIIMLSFCLFEACVGVFDPWISTMRSEHVPDRVMATVMTLSRVPLNLLVGIGVHLTENYSLVLVFGICAMLHLMCAMVCTALLLPPSSLRSSSAHAKAHWQ